MTNINVNIYNIGKICFSNFTEKITILTGGGGGEGERERGRESVS